MEEKPKNEKENSSDIKKLKYPTKREAILLKSKKTLKRIFAAYGMSALLGVAGGKGVQNIERKMIGFDEETREKFHQLQEKLSDKENTTTLEEHKSKLREWADKLLKTTKEVADGTMFDEIRLGYYKILNFIDDVTFLVPAILIFIMLGKYANRFLKKINGGDPVQKKKEELVLNKINEIVEKLNSYDLNNISKEQQEEAKKILEDNKDIFDSI